MRAQTAGSPHAVGQEGGPAPLFLFSLPRSGSTLAQRILASHEDVATVSEPWVLLPYFYALKKRGVYAEYNHTSAALAIEDFCEALPGGRDAYVSEVRELALRLYARAARGGEAYFLDKTPRYHLISSEILDAFPDGKHVFLWRNPLAVVSSIIETWGGGKWNVHRHKVDLFDGLAALIEAYARDREAVHAVRYEDLLTRPQETWEGVFRYLELPHDPSVLGRFGGVKLGGNKGDPTGTRRYDGISREPLDGWRRVLNTPLRRAWCRRYLRWIGAERLEVMGYDLDRLMAELDGLPMAYGRLWSDAWRGPYGLAYDLLEPKIFRHKLRTLPDLRHVHAHK